MLISNDDQVLLCDFGLAGVLDEAKFVMSHVPSSHSQGFRSVYYAQCYFVLIVFDDEPCSLAYTCPEVINGAAKSPQSDVYALAISIFEVCPAAEVLQCSSH